MADALKALNRPAQAIQALEAAAERDAPTTSPSSQKLDESRRATGILVRRVTHRSRKPIRRAPASTSPSRRPAATTSTPRTG